MPGDLESRRFGESIDIWDTSRITHVSPISPITSGVWSGVFSEHVY